MFFPYIKNSSKILSKKKKTKKTILQRKACENYQNLSEEEIKHATMPVIDTESFLSKINLVKNEKTKDANKLSIYIIIF